MEKKHRKRNKQKLITNYITLFETRGKYTKVARGSGAQFTRNNRVCVARVLFAKNSHWLRSKWLAMHFWRMFGVPELHESHIIQRTHKQARLPNGSGARTMTFHC